MRVQKGSATLHVSLFVLIPSHPDLNLWNETPFRDNKTILVMCEACPRSKLTKVIRIRSYVQTGRDLCFGKFGKTTGFRLRRRDHVHDLVPLRHVYGCLHHVQGCPGGDRGEQELRGRGRIPQTTRRRGRGARESRVHGVDEEVYGGETSSMVRFKISFLLFVFFRRKIYDPPGPLF